MGAARRFGRWRGGWDEAWDASGDGAWGGGNQERGGGVETGDSDRVARVGGVGEGASGGGGTSWGRLLGLGAAGIELRAAAA